MTVLHITMTPFNHETRLIKQVEAVVSGNRNLTCHILALNDGKSVEEETIGKYIFVRRLFYEQLDCQSIQSSDT